MRKKGMREETMKKITLTITITKDNKEALIDLSLGIRTYLKLSNIIIKKTGFPQTMNLETFLVSFFSTTS